MNLYFIQLFAVLICIDTTWADQKIPWVFFVKLNDTLVPLFGWYRGERFQGVSIFAYGDSSLSPTEFSFANKSVYTTQFTERQSVGFYAGDLVFGRGVPAAKMRFDRNWKVLGVPFYSCDLLTASIRGIFHEVHDKRVSYCFEVEIYFLPYLRETKSAVPVVSPEVFEEFSSEKPCELRYTGDHMYENRAKWLSTYKGNCTVYINNELMYKKNYFM